ncbi:MAG: N-acetylmuramoyl-L-alanine amidase, partial [Lachnospiraceae bacterium]|nr:N-acetylmuramoyl-L-alanine amidase [Lachnospiraceae bacterium]
KGKIKGKKKLDSDDWVYLVVRSKNDPENVYHKVRVKVTAAGESSSSKDDDDDKKSSSSLVICIDPGHGGTDSGASYYGINEKNVNLAIAKKLKSVLENSYGVEVHMTRDTDKSVSLTDRTDKAKDEDCDLFVSIHCNAADSTSTVGTMVFYSVKSAYAKKSLASHISSAVASALSTSDKGAKTRASTNDANTDYYSVIRTSAAKGIPGLIVEHGFLSNSAEAAKLNNSSYQESIAKAEAKAIYNYWQ